MAGWTIPEPVLPIDDAGARAAIRRVAGQAVGLVGGVEDLEIPVPGSEWTFRAAACHLVTVFRAFGASLEGRLDSLDQAVAEVEALSDRHALARHLDDAAQRFVAAAAERAPDDVMATPWYGRDQTHLVGAMTCLVLGEAVLHGWDLAQAAGRPWPLEADDARLIISGAFPAKAPVITDPDAASGVDVTYEVRPDAGPAFSMRFADAAGVVVPVGTRPPDCVLEGDPVAVVLWVYGRATTEALFASGRIRASGADPSLGRTFKAFLRDP